MSKKKNQIERAIEALEEQKAAILTKANAEAGALEHAIKQLRAQQVKKASKPRAVERATDAKPA